MIRGDLVAASVGGWGLTYPLWGSWLNSGWQVGIAILGAIVLVLTIWNKVLEIKQRRKDLKK